MGGGPTGLFTALMLARRGYQNITVYDRLPRPDDPSSPTWGNPYRSYNLGLGARGQIALRAADAWESIEPFCAQAIGRKDWTPEQGERPEQIYTDREYKTQVIQRDRIASCLLGELERKHGNQVSVWHSVECVGLTWLDEATPGPEASPSSAEIGKKGVRLRLHRQCEGQELEQWTTEARWVVGADGVRSALRSALEVKTGPGGHQGQTQKERVRTIKLPERNEFVYKILPLDLRPKYGTGPGWRPDLNYSARSKGEVTIEALPTREGIYVGVVLFRPDSSAMAKIQSKEDAREFFAGSFPQFLDVIREEDLARFSTGPTFRLPSFSYCGPSIFYRDNTLLLGDCIHSVKPYFGLGLNSALEDVMALDKCLSESEDDVSKVGGLGGMGAKRPMHCPASAPVSLTCPQALFLSSVGCFLPCRAPSLSTAVPFALVFLWLFSPSSSLFKSVFATKAFTIDSSPSPPPLLFNIFHLFPIVYALALSLNVVSPLGVHAPGSAFIPPPVAPVSSSSPPNDPPFPSSLLSFQALPLFSSRTAPQAKALVEFQASFDYNANTLEGFLRFVLPLILDGIFHRYFPAFFAPNGIRLLQDHRSTFRQTRRRKQRDRIGQAVILGVLLTGIGKGLGWAVKVAARMLLKG